MPSHHRHRSGKSRRTETEPEEAEENNVVDPQLIAEYEQLQEYQQGEYIFEGNEDDIYGAEDQVQARYTYVPQGNDTYGGNYADYYAQMADNPYPGDVYPGETAGGPSYSPLPPKYCPVCKVCHKLSRDVNRCLRKIEKPIKCEAENPCGHETAQQKDMNRHYWAHHRSWAEKNGVPNTMTDCLLCGESFMRSDYLKKHMERRHPDSQHESKKDKDKKEKKHGKKK